MNVHLYRTGNLSGSIGDWVPLKEFQPVNGSLPVVSTSGAGVTYEMIMNPRIQANANSSNAQEFQTDSSGWLSLYFVVAGITAPSSQVCVFGWSTTVNDQTTVKTALDTWTTPLTGKIVVPDGTATSGLMTIPLVPGFQSPRVVFDSTAPVKTWGLELSGNFELSALRILAFGTKAS